MKYLKLFEDYDFYDAKENWQELYDIWFKKYLNFSKSKEGETSAELRKLLDDGLKFEEAFNISNISYRNKLKDWKEQNPPPIFEEGLKLQKESEKNEELYQILLNTLKLNKTGYWGSGPFDDELGNFSNDGKIMLSVKPHYVEEEDIESEEYMDGIILELIKVNPKFANKGYAERKMKQFVDVVDELGFTVHLDVIPQDDNTEESRLINFYKKYGFIIKSQGSTVHMIRYTNKQTDI